ncbi:hypothetical protein HMPREF2738_01768 [Clostridiales bacterium KLE1615]|nr:hypothetical protein HMPREF2738_01768 [Clostridiales bacterium KLE1615]
MLTFFDYITVLPDGTGAIYFDTPDNAFSDSISAKAINRSLS